jgi:hypothetical protein
MIFGHMRKFCKRSFLYRNYRKSNMSYEIDIPDKIQRIIDKKLDKHLKERLYKKLLKLELAPHSYAKPLRLECLESTGFKICSAFFYLFHQSRI